MIAQVVISLAARALDAPFSYEVPQDLIADIAIGDAAIVELGGKKVLGFIVALRESADVLDVDFELKPLLAHISGPYFTNQSYELAIWIAHYYAAPLSEALKLFLPTGLMSRLKKALANYSNTGEAKMPVRRPRKSSEHHDVASDRDPHLRPGKLTLGQEKALAAVCDTKKGKPLVLEGVTGSGKTEVYLQAIEAARKSGKSAIMLVPEISLTPQTVGRIRSRFGDDVAVLHSGLSDGERYTQWEKVRTGECGVVVGARSALFAPVVNLGLVIIDEEHDGSYKQNNSPRYHAREVAEKLCTLTGACLVLGSATPSLEALHAAETGRYELVKLPERVNGQPLPQVEIVDLRREFGEGHKSMFSRKLLGALRKVQSREKKAILLLNRRGFANFVLCRECGYVPGCEACSVSLTYHAPQNHLRCHQCNCIQPVPAQCPSCNSPYLRQFGGGVQRVEQEFREHFPDWPLVRMDADTTSTRGAHAALLEEFSNNRTGVLLGTQMVAKGHDFPDVTLVGVINADVTLNLPDFRASERGYQLLEQVAGRAGRADLTGEVIIQTYNPENSACRAVKAHDSEILMSNERIMRKAFGYPPYAALCNIVISGIDELKVKKFSERLTEALRASKNLRTMKATLMGPAPCMLSRKARSYRYHIMIKAGPGAQIGSAVQEVLKGLSKTADIKVAVDVNPTDTF
ncbi:MAG: primosomal protein N' [Coriobacteriia bacterium]|nr:primosomal protein N' [Coriobacteriia bacterium]MCL2870742.1 primosomal protein N' [Coriobacteriia bacterium]